MLDQAVRSALAQGDVIGEVLIVDDASPVPVDPAAWVDDRVRVLRHEVNRGAAAARNSGVAAARHEWIAFLDSDDAWHPDKLRLQAAALDPADLVVSVTGWLGTQDGKDRPIAPAPADTLDAFLRGCWFSPGSTAFFSRAVWDAIGPFDEDLPRLEDYEWFLRLGLAGGRLAVDNRALTAIRRHRTTDPSRVVAATQRLAARYCDPLRAPRRLDAPQRRKIHAYLALERAAAHYYRGHPRFLADLAASWLWRPRLRLHVAPAPGPAQADEIILSLAAELSNR